MLTVIACLAVVALSVAVVVCVVLLDDPEPAPPPRRTPPSGAPAHPAPGGPDQPWWRREARCFVEIFALCGFVVAQPVLGSFGESPETFVSVDASAGTIVTFGVAVVLVPALSLWALVAATGLVGAQVRRLTQSAAVGLLVGLFVSLSTPGLLPGPASVATATVAAGLLAAFVHGWFPPARLYLAFASPAPVAFLVVFVAFSPVANLLFVPAPDAAASPSGTPSAQPSVVMVVLDELPTMSLLDGSDRVDAELFPNFARFADDATFYRNHTTLATFTVVAMPALLTGRIPTDVAAVRGDYVENLFTLLGDSHQLNVHEPLTPCAQHRSAARALAPAPSETWGRWPGACGRAW